MHLRSNLHTPDSHLQAVILIKKQNALMMKFKYSCVLFFGMLMLPTIAFSLDHDDKKNALSVEVLSPLDKTYAISYARKLNDNVELTIKPRIRIKKQNDLESDKNFLFSEDPFWYYSRFMIRTGLMFRHKVLFCEPAFHYEYGYFKNKIVCYEDSEGECSDDYMRGNRSYHSFGGISTVGLIFNLSRIRFKMYGGTGLHYRYYHEIRYEEWIESYSSNHRDVENKYRNYERLIPSLHLGVEVGFRF